nr:MAG TPA: hypothetical protein [Caudoviricetes sp.]
MRLKKPVVSTFIRCPTGFFRIQGEIKGVKMMLKFIICVYLQSF